MLYYLTLELPGKCEEHEVFRLQINKIFSRRAEKYRNKDKEEYKYFEDKANEIVYKYTRMPLDRFYQAQVAILIIC